MGAGVIEFEVEELFGLVEQYTECISSMRLEKGFKGAPELTNEVTLPEADVMRFCRIDKGDFIGREATLASLQKAENGGLPWVCAQLEVDAQDADPHSSETVFCHGDKVGQVSSGGLGLYTEKSLAFAYIRPEAAVPGTDLEVLVLGEKRPAKVLAEPVYDPANEQPRRND